MRSSPPPPRSPRYSRSGTSQVESSFKRKALNLALFLILVASILNALFGDRGFIELLKARQELQILEQEIAEIKANNQQILEEIRALKTSPFAVERLAREQLGMVKPDEIVLLTPKPPPAVASPPKD